VTLAHCSNKGATPQSLHTLIKNSTFCVNKNKNASSLKRSVGGFNQFWG